LLNINYVSDTFYQFISDMCYRCFVSNVQKTHLDTQQSNAK